MVVCPCISDHDDPFLFLIIIRKTVLIVWSMEEQPLKMPLPATVLPAQSAWPSLTRAGVPTL